MDEALEVFIESSLEHVERIEQAILDMEDGGTVLPLLEQVFRSVHTIKGDAKCFDLNGLVQMCHAMEDRLTIMRSNGSAQGKDTINDLLDRLDQIQICVLNAQQD